MEVSSFEKRLLMYSVKCLSSYIVRSIIRKSSDTSKSDCARKVVMLECDVRVRVILFEKMFLMCDVESLSSYIVLQQSK